MGHNLDDTDPKISELNTEILSLKKQVNNANMEGNVITVILSNRTDLEKGSPYKRRRTINEVTIQT